jgi:hypothetical protein
MRRVTLGDTGVRVYLACGVTDMRKGIDGLAAKASQDHELGVGKLGHEVVPPGKGGTISRPTTPSRAPRGARRHEPGQASTTL